MNDAELQHYYFGLYRVLKRYRTTSILGWTVVFVACGSIPFGWNLGRSTGFIEVALTVLTILSGLVVVWQNISALEEYVRIPFPFAPETDEAKAMFVADIRALLKDIDDGGWQEAFAAVGRLKELQIKYGLPELEPKKNH